MARLFSSGFELGSNGNNFDFHTSNGVIVVDTSNPRSGTYCLHTTALVSGTAQRVSFRHVGAEVAGHWFFRKFFRPSTRPTAANTIIKFAGSFNVITVKLDNLGKLVLADEVGTIGTSASALTNGQYYRIEIEFDSTTAPGAHVIRLRVDDVIFVESAARTFTHTSIQQMDIGGNLGGEAQTVGDWCWDDIGINDTTGTAQTSWCGDGKIVHLRPTANGDANSGQVRGGADSGADWSQLSEVTPNDATDYIELNTTTGVVWVNITDSVTVGIGGAYVISLVAVGGRITLASAGAGNWFPSLKSQASGATLDGAPVTLALATWASHDDTSGSQQYKVTAYVDPQTGGAWTATKLDSTQIGAKTTDGSPATRISALWALVEYIPFTVTVPTTLKGGLTGGLSVPSGGLL